MENKYIVKDFKTQLYYCGKDYGWCNESWASEYFNTFEDAKLFVLSQEGKFVIEMIFIVD